MGVEKLGSGSVSLPKTAAKTKLWTMEQCPACQSGDISTNYYTGEVFCLKCGLVIY